MNNLLQIIKTNEIKDIVKAMPIETKFQQLFIAKKLVAEYEKELDSSIKSGNISDTKIEFHINDSKIIGTLSKGKTTIEESESNEIAWSKVLQFAEERELIYRTTELVKKIEQENPSIFTQEVVSSKALDTDFMQEQDWFKENIEQFLIKNKVQNTKQSYDRITFKEAK